MKRKKIKLLLLVAAIGLLGYGRNAAAGAQQEEALADSVRVALANSITDRSPKPDPGGIEDRRRYRHWVDVMMERLKVRVPDSQARLQFLESVWYEATRAGLEPALVLGLIQVESGFRRYAVSAAGAYGYMQVMPFWTRAIGDGNRRRLFHMQTNLRYGCAILRMYLDMEDGNLFFALGRYNGSRGNDRYPRTVLRAWEAWRIGDGGR